MLKITFDDNVLGFSFEISEGFIIFTKIHVEDDIINVTSLKKNLSIILSVAVLF